jgi:hypothetical protein
MFSGGIITTSLGVCVITATQSGSADWLPAPDLVANVGVSPIAVSASTSVGVMRQPITLTAFVRLPTVQAAQLHGSVRFYDGATSLGARSVVNGSARLTVGHLAVGDRQISAVFTYAKTGQTYTSSTTHVLIGPATTTLSLGTAKPTAGANRAVVLVASLTRLSPAAGKAQGGTVSFFENSTLLGTAPVDRTGRSRLTVRFTSGDHLITASFSGSPTDIAAVGSSHVFVL